MSSSAAGIGRAWGWVAHLRSGGTTPWAAWQGTSPATGPLLPGAQQLELLRRMNVAFESSARPRGEIDHQRSQLADRVLTAAASGRGKPDLGLEGASSSPWGPRPVDPSSLRPGDLTRVAATLLAEDLVAAGAPSEREPLGKPWRRRHRLIGDPLIVGHFTATLNARGRPQGGPLPHVVVAAGPLDELLAHTWTRRCFEHGITPWHDWLRYWRGRDQLPARLDLPHAAARWAQRPSQVRIVTDHSRLTRELGVRHLPEVAVPGADAAELARRIAPLVGLLVPAEQRPPLMWRTLLPRLPDSGLAPVAVPATERAWVERAAERMTRQLRRAGYPVVGDLADLTPQFHSRGQHDRVEHDREALEHHVLDLAVRTLIDPRLTTTEGTGRQ